MARSGLPRAARARATVRELRAAQAGRSQLRRPSQRGPHNCAHIASMHRIHDPMPPGTRTNVESLLTTMAPPIVCPAPGTTEVLGTARKCPHMCVGRWAVCARL